MNIIFDCNVIISAGRTDGICRNIILYAILQYQIITSNNVISEYKTTSKRPKHKKYYEQTKQLIELIEKTSTTVSPIPCKHHLPHEQDKIYLTTALAGKADFCITGNVTGHSPP